MTLGPNLLSGPAKAHLIKQFLAPEEAQTALLSIKNETRWESREILMFGKKVMQPRLVAWQADPGKTYRYSGVTMNPDPWGATVLKIRERLETFLGASFNSVLLNLYRNGQDSMGWHRDNEPELGPEPLIASISLGAERRFWFRTYRKHDKKIEMTLPMGSLLVMSGATQDLWEHSLPKSMKITDPRINLTFRFVR